MEFLVTLIEVTETKNEEARKDLQANCTHVANNFWLYEGEEWALHEGIIFNTIGNAALECYGDKSGCQLKQLLKDTYNVDKCFID